MCGLKVYGKVHELLSGSVSTGCRHQLTYDSTSDYTKSQSVRLILIDTQLKVLESNFSSRLCAYQEKTG